MDAKELLLTLDLGTARPTGSWCPTCQLPSGYEADVLSVSEHGVSRVATVRGCTNEDDPAKHRAP